MAQHGKSGNRTKHVPDAVPSLKRDLLNAKLFMQQSSSESGDSLFDHLSRVIARVIDERPSNVVDCFELFSGRVRSEKFRTSENQAMLVDENRNEPERMAIAQRLLLIAKSQQQQQPDSDVNKNELESIAASDEEAEAASSDKSVGDVNYSGSKSNVRDLCELQFYWNLLGIGFPREEVFSLSCAMRKLKTDAAGLASCRFWGKIFGRSSDYYIVECTLTEDALEARIVSAFACIWP
jgi:radial spoke head protein 4A